MKLKIPQSTNIKLKNINLRKVYLKYMKNEAQKDLLLFNYLKEKKVFSKKWHIKKTENAHLQEILNKTSKKDNGERGEPDFIYLNEEKKILILIENKDSVKDHFSKEFSKEQNNAQKFAVDGIKHYLKFFTKNFLEKEKQTIQNYFKNWKFVGLAISGNIEEEYSHKISSFIIKKNKIENINNNNILNEKEYLALFENINIEEIINTVSKSSNDLNQILRHMDSQKRPIILSSLLICLFDGIKNDFRDNYNSYSPDVIIHNISFTIEYILKNEKIPKDKIEILQNQFDYAIKDDIDIATSDVLKDVLQELQNNVLPLFKTKTNYDIIGKFYEEFLKYAGVTNVKNGIVLTPRHITQLFTELVDIKLNDIIFDPCCGTGAFLIAGMNKIIREIENSKIPNKQELKEKVKENQLIGFEKNPTMFALSISNMLFRGDGKSQIYHLDFFADEIEKQDKTLKEVHAKNEIAKILKQKKPDIGFINPPYGGLDNKKNPTKKEIQFLIKLLENCKRYVVMIAPLSTYFKEEDLRNKILAKHTLKVVLNMPQDLFQPNASTHTAISVFETNTPHNNKEVLFYNLKEDGFVLSKQKGRTDVLEKWEGIKKDLLQKIKHQFSDDIDFVKTAIKENDEWILQAHAKTDYSQLKEEDFLNSIREYIIFKTKKDLDLLDKDLDEIKFMEILNNQGIDGKSFLEDD